MVTGEAIVPGAAALADAKAFLRILGQDEDALIEHLLATAADCCEQFTGRVLFVRGFAETLGRPQGMWRRLARTPVRAITGAEIVDAAGGVSPLGAGAYAVDIDACGDGWVRVTEPGGAGSVRVAYEAGLAGQWEDLPEALAQGAIRLAAHLYAVRDEGDDRGPPAVVSALWRPYRRLRIGSAAHV